MPYISSINHHNYTVTLQSQDALTHLTLDDLALSLDWRQLAHGSSPTSGRYTVLIAGRSYDIFARRISTPADNPESTTYEIMLDGQRFEVTVEDERARLLSSVARSSATGNTAKIQAPMPGLVVNVLSTPGSPVEAGEAVVVLEAMKMENDLASPISGTLKEIKVQKGQAVEQGEVLALIEAAPTE